MVYRPVKEEKDFVTFLLRAVVSGEDSKDKLKNYLKEVTPDFKGKGGGGGSSRGGSYWAFDFEKEGDLEEEIDCGLERLVEHNLITEDLSATEEGVLLCAKGIGVKTYLYFKELNLPRFTGQQDKTIINLMEVQVTWKERKDNLPRNLKKRQ